MRDINRIDDFCNKLAQYWKKYASDWRFGQLVLNVLGTSKIDPFFLEEEDILKLFAEFFAPVEEQKEESTEEITLEILNDKVTQLMADVAKLCENLK